MEFWIIGGVLVYWVIGLAYVATMPKINFKLEWLVSAILAWIWPYFLLIRTIKVHQYMVEQKMRKAKYEADKEGKV